MVKRSYIHGSSTAHSVREGPVEIIHICYTLRRSVLNKHIHLYKVYSLNKVIKYNAIKMNDKVSNV